MSLRTTSLRAFIAVDVPPSLRVKLTDLADKLRRQIGSDDVVWVRPEGIHLTLKFLGDIPVQSVDGLQDMLDEVARRHTPFPVNVGGLGGFPSLRQPRVIWVGVRESSGVLLRLQRDVESGTERLGYPHEERDFSPHLTLGRVRRGVVPAQIRRLGELLGKTDAADLGELFADHLSLFSSELGPAGVVYTRLTVSKLGG